jgi:hypothetical protein
MKNLDETSYLKLTTLLSPFFPMSCDPYSSKESYCLTASLVSSAGKYCLDSSGVTKEIGQDLNCLGDGTSKNPYRCPETPSKMKFPMKEPSFFPPLS